MIRVFTDIDSLHAEESEEHHVQSSTRVPSYKQAMNTGFNLRDFTHTPDDGLQPDEMTQLDLGISWHLVHSRTREHEFNCEWYTPASAGYSNLDDATFNELVSMGIDPNDVREFHIVSSSN